MSPSFCRLTSGIFAACLVGVVHGCSGLPIASAVDPQHPQEQEAAFDYEPLPPAVGDYSMEGEPLPTDTAGRETRPTYESDRDEGSGWLFNRSRGERSARPGTSPGGAVLPPTGSRPRREEGSGFEWSDLSPKSIYDDLKELAGYGPNEGIARQHYREGEELFRQEQYREAASKFSAAADRWPDSPLQEDALFMLAESQFFSDQYPEAQETYVELLEKYDYTRHLDTATERLFRIARYWEQMAETQTSVPLGLNLTDSSRPTFDAFGHALRTYQQVRLHDPTGPLADDSLMATANAYFSQGRYEQAAYHYDLVRKEYPRSEHLLNAHLLGMKSRQNMYQGPKYDAAPLVEAGKIADQTLTQFRTELGSERDRVITTRNLVIEEQAARDWTIGQYYDRKKHYGAARYYYQLILEDYPHTVAAGKARARLEEIRELPAEPPNRFEWLTQLFDERD